MGPAVVGCHRQFPARTLLCGGADVLACKIRFSPEIEATRNGWCAWARCGGGCHGRNPCGLGSIKPVGRTRTPSASASLQGHCRRTPPICPDGCNEQRWCAWTRCGSGCRGRHVPCQKMCKMHSGGGAGDRGDADSAAGQHELRGASSGHEDLGTTHADTFARHRRLAVFPWCIPSIATLLP